MPSSLTFTKLNIKTALKHLKLYHMMLKIIQQVILMFDKIKMILMMKTSISNNRISQFNQYIKNFHFTQIQNDD